MNCSVWLQNSFNLPDLNFKCILIFTNKINWISVLGCHQFCCMMHDFGPRFIHSGFTKFGSLLSIFTWGQIIPREYFGPHLRMENLTISRWIRWSHSSFMGRELQHMKESTTKELTLPKHLHEFTQPSQTIWFNIMITAMTQDHLVTCVNWVRLWHLQAIDMASHFSTGGTDQHKYIGRVLWRMSYGRTDFYACSLSNHINWAFIISSVSQYNKIPVMPALNQEWCMTRDERLRD